MNVGYHGKAGQSETHLDDTVKFPHT